MKATPAKKQQSISSFFTPKSTVNGLSQKSESQSTSATLQNDSHEVNIYDAESNNEEEDDDEPIVRKPRSPKRPLVEDADALNNGTSRPSKRVRNAGGESESPSFLSENVPAKATFARELTSNSKKSAVTPRTERYLYNSSSQSISGAANGEDADEGEGQDDEAVRRQKEILHQKFVKKLGHPDSLALIKRRNWQITEETAALDEEGGGEDDDEEGTPAPMKGKKKGAKTGKLTPMEIQMLDIKRQHMDAILIVEVGYKFKFFGEDARIAAKELGIVCIPGKYRFDEHPSEAHLDRFASASIPVFRLPVHAKRLVLAGHKVGVVRQLETAALKKAGDNRNTPFIRKLTNLYTKGTYIDDIEGLEQPSNAPPGGAPGSGYLLCLTETPSKGMGTDEKVDVGILAVQPMTGDVIYDNFEDGFMRSELETRLLHISPCEFLIVGDLTKATEKLVQHLSGSSTNVFGDKVRVERVEKPKTMAAQSYSHVAQFYAGKMKEVDANDERASNLLDKVLKLSEPVTICLSAMITHMTEFGLEHVFDLTKYFQSFSARSHMLLQGTTLTSLEIYSNQTDHSEKGSLFWSLDKTQTRFGKRLLRKWVGRPLLDKEKLEERVAAVEELKEGNQTPKVDKLKSLLMKIKSDLERSLIRIYYGKCSRPELLTVLQTLQRIANEFAEVKTPSDAGFKSSLLGEAIAALPVMGDSVISFLDKMNLEAARTDDKYEFFRESEESEDIGDQKMGIAAVEQELDAHRLPAAQKLGKKSPVTYMTVAGIEYLIEVSNTEIKKVPASWQKISGTKAKSRFHTPEVVKMIRERDQYKEALAAACDVAFANLLSEIAAHYQSFRDCVSALATLDCLMSLATVASQPGYVKPNYSDETEISITDGRHPMVEQLLLESYVPNDTNLSSNEGTRALLITGPNMGGKSSYVRQVALICIMAQIGSYVPAAAARLGMLDAVFTRMGAFDNMMAGESTFMVELSETSDILKQATPRSLVILDELGRGTSTHDGVAIAQAVLDHVVRDVKCLTLFITHYQTLSSVANGFEKEELRNVHMSFKESGKKGEEDITFLFTVDEGVAHRSYGLNVARLARVPKDVLELAAVKSREMEEEGKEKKLLALVGIVGKVLGGNGQNEESVEALEALIKGVELL